MLCEIATRRWRAPTWLRTHQSNYLYHEDNIFSGNYSTFAEIVNEGQADLLDPPLTESVFHQ